MDVISALVAFWWWLVDATCKMFYIVSPHELALNTSDPMPKYMLKQGIPMFFVMIIFERIMMAFFSSGGKRASDAKGKGAKGKAEGAAAGAGDSLGMAVPLTPWYRLNDMVASTVAGSFQQVGLLLFELVGVTLTVGVYKYVWANFRVFDVDPKEHVWLSYIVLMLGKDFGYYWMHRTLHEFHIMWASHSVHHSGEDYNLATGLRQGVCQPFWAPPFYVWMAVLGFPPQAFAAHAQLNTLYMYWIHTDMVNRMPFPLEYIMNGPMAHRLHHRPPGNCNYAGMFIIWDRMFGTYKAEVVRKDWYGLAKQPMTFDPVKLNTNHFKRMADIGASDDPGSRRNSWAYRICARRVPARWRFSVAALFKPIPALKEDLRGNGPVRPKWNGAAPMSWFTAVFLTLLSLGSLVGLVTLLIVAHRMHVLDAAAGVLLAGGLLASVGHICDQKPGAYQAAMLAGAAMLGTLVYVLSKRPAAAMLSQ